MPGASVIFAYVKILKFAFLMHLFQIGRHVCQMRKTILAGLLILAVPAFAQALVLDPGHSPASPGAASCTGQKEYIYNYALARHVQNYLHSRNIPVTLSKSPSRNLSLTARTKGTAGQNLFVSLHHDSVQPQYLDPSGPYPVSSKARGYSIFISRKNKYYRQSLEYARKIAETLYKSGLRPSTHHGEKIKGENRKLVDARLGIYDHDDLVVLKSAQSPALLLEAGVLVSPEDEKLVKTAAFKDTVARAILEAVK